ncbi:hypothetical protein ACWE42_18870 [Sutcliffiella cohnii]|nr:MULTISPECIES: hypothetical protein [Sutcliffiella]MED4016867.1 hypothetical protein [Sutcliffiella cohnii]WBL16232.1 hypothetical protein O1A01_06270 [Sutcliffiella sp. NC1]
MSNVEKLLELELLLEQEETNLTSLGKETIERLKMELSHDVE